MFSLPSDANFSSDSEDTLASNTGLLSELAERLAVAAKRSILLETGQMELNDSLQQARNECSHARAAIHSLENLVEELRARCASVEAQCASVENVIASKSWRPWTFESPPPSATEEQSCSDSENYSPISCYSPDGSDGLIVSHDQIEGRSASSSEEDAQSDSGQDNMREHIASLLAFARASARQTAEMSSGTKSALQARALRELADYASRLQAETAGKMAQIQQLETELTAAKSSHLRLGTEVDEARRRIAELETKSSEKVNSKVYPGISPNPCLRPPVSLRYPSALADRLALSTCCPIIDFINAIRAAGDMLRAAPITAVVSYRVVDPDDRHYKIRLGPLSHHFILLAVHIPDLARASSIRIDYGPDVHYITFSDNWPELRAGAAEIGRLDKRNQPIQMGPSLAGLASLLEIVHSRFCVTNILSQNCFWFTETILFAMARKFSSHWLGGRVAPVALQRYAGGELLEEALRATSTDAEGLLIHGPVLKLVGRNFLGVTRTMQLLLTASQLLDTAPHDIEVDCIVQAWNQEVTASS
ncbi:hypothetical protein WOLCODRAFT_164569 [Wolfiporia cocos MD-104 SS10]|uniref:Uncharacterized protein n=1 Tax=Wolfiporia cocos (strain MD-104) TaxID=742152 RepID=A0A2H3JN42_WOLCO|nr:hypothetical protein WOLCODRAFT_164569 [Wolfiporia cocos MD-104 SS10]